MAMTIEQLLAHKGRQIITVEPTTTIRDAVALFGEHAIGAVVVCVARRVVGVLSERDCVSQLLWRCSATLDSPVSAVMRTDTPSVEPGDSIEHGMALMTDRRTRHLPVVAAGELVGVISAGDLINAQLREQEYLIESLEGYISGSPSVRAPAH